MSHRIKRWTVEEEAKLIEYSNQSMPIDDIALKLHRSGKAILLRLQSIAASKVMEGSSVEEALTFTGLTKEQLLQATIEKKTISDTRSAYSKKKEAIAKLDKTTLNKTTLDKTTLDKTTLDKTNLDKTTLDKTTLDKTTLDKTTLDKTTLDVSDTILYKQWMGQVLSLLVKIEQNTRQKIDL